MTKSKSEINEQIAAITSERGILLDAGAGSGKTYVIIEHIFFKLENLYQSMEIKNTDHYHQQLKKYFKKTCILTFTENAINEIKTRIKRTLDQKIMMIENEIMFEQKEKLAFFLQVRDLIGVLTVSTIHGLCYKLLKQGISLDFDSDFEIKDEFYLAMKFEKIFDPWFERHYKIEQSGRPNPLNYVHKRNLIELLVKIFSDSHLRKNWKEFFLEHHHQWQNHHENLQVRKINCDEVYFNAIMEVNLFRKLLILPDLQIDGLKKENKFTQVVRSLFEIVSSYLLQRNVLDEENLLKLNRSFVIGLFEFFNQIKSMPPLPKELKTDQEMSLYWGNVGKLKKFLKENSVSLFDFKEEKLKIKNQLFTVIGELFANIEKSYLTDRKITYGDLEYYVHSILENSENETKIKSESKTLNGNENKNGTLFDYMIIDEFQDVSRIQYLLFKFLVASDHARIFAVGDVKQSIYRFRGGEIEVFKDFEMDNGQILVLHNNYRSYPQIVEFNNHLFEYLLNRIKEEDLNSIFPELTKQNPTKRENPLEIGVIEQVRLDPQDELNLLATEEAKHSLDLYEAKAIAARMTTLESEEKLGHTFAVLYKKIRPSYLLMQELKKRKISFRAQMKMNYGDDFFFDVFFRLYEISLENESSLEDKVKKTVPYFTVYLEMAGYENTENLLATLAETIGRFYVQCEFMGPYEALVALYYTLQVTYQEAGSFFQILKNIYQSAADIEEMYSLLKKKRDDQYTFFYEYDGEKFLRHPVQLMTVHMSKGLEFHYVWIAGIYTNQRSGQRPGSNILGKTPGAIKIKENRHEKKYIKSPEYLVEEITEKNHEAAESIRLLYVACTRAKSYFGHFSFSPETYLLLKEDKAVGEKSWGSYLNDFERDAVHPKVLKFFSVYTTPHLDLKNSKMISKSLFSLSVMHKNFAMKTSLTSTDDHEQLMAITDLSVTRLAMLGDCPRKFYFANICRFGDQEVAALSEIFPQQSLANITGAMTPTMASNPSLISSKERGTSWHLMIRNMVNKLKIYGSSFSIETFMNSLLLDHKNEQAELFRQKFLWVYQQIIQLWQSQQYQIYPEKELKYPFKNIILSGTPDLIFLANPALQNAMEIWDFKTGEFTAAKEGSYWTQLFLYAHGLTALKYHQNSQVILKIVYTDEMKIHEKVIDTTQMDSFLEQIWQKITTPVETNIRHCGLCSFDKICHKNLQS